MSLISLTDYSIFPYGKYNKARYTMEEVPSWFLLSQYDYFKPKAVPGSPIFQVCEYVRQNYDILKSEVKEDEKTQ